MPIPKRQSPVPAKRAPVESDDAWDMLDTMSMIVYGISGSGKTTFAATFPGPILWLVCSGGKKPQELKSIDTPEYREKITAKIIRSSADYDRWMEKAPEYATVVLDHLSALSDVVLSEITGQRVPEQKSWGMFPREQYGQQTSQLKSMLRVMLDLPGNVVILGQERVFEPKEGSIGGETKVGIGVSPKLAEWLNPIPSYVVQTFKRKTVIEKHVVSKKTGEKKVIQLEGEGIQFCLRTEPHELYITKFRNPYAKEKKLTGIIVDPTYKKVMQVLGKA